MTLTATRAVGSFLVPVPGEYAGWSPATRNLYDQTGAIAQRILTAAGYEAACRTADPAWNAACLAPARVEAIRRLSVLGQPEPPGSLLHLTAQAGEGGDPRTLIGLSRELAQQMGLADYQFSTALYEAGQPFAPRAVAQELLPGSGVMVEVPVADNRGTPPPELRALRDAWEDCERRYAHMQDAARNGVGVMQLSENDRAAWLAIRDRFTYSGPSGYVGNWIVPEDVTAAIDDYFAPCFDAVREQAQAFTGGNPTPPRFDPRDEPPPEPPRDEPPPDVEVRDWRVIYDTPPGPEPRPLSLPAPATVAGLSPLMVGGLLLLLLLLLGGRS